MSTQVAHRRKKHKIALWRVDDGWPREMLISCPACKALDVIRFTDQAMIPTRKFAQKAGRIYHDCGSARPCRLHVLHRSRNIAAGPLRQPRHPQRHPAIA